MIGLQKMNQNKFCNNCDFVKSFGISKKIYQCKNKNSALYQMEVFESLTCDKFEKKDLASENEQSNR
jgi:hypothetical protein